MGSKITYSAGKNNFLSVLIKFFLEENKFLFSVKFNVLSVLAFNKEKLKKSVKI